MRRSDRRIAIALTMAAGCATTALACQMLVPIDGAPQHDAAVEQESSVDAAPDADHVACGPVLPDPPTSTDSRDTQGSIVFAMYAMTIRGADAKAGLYCDDIGFDLDRSYTPDDASLDCRVFCEPAANATSSSLGAGPETRCDFARGVDNSLSKLVGAAASLTGIAGDAVDGFDPSLFASKGVTNLLVDLHGYNGTPDDPQVTVFFYASAGIEGLSLDGGKVSLKIIKSLPEIWDGGQDAAWTIEDRAVTGEAGSQVRPPIYRAAGYVRDGVLVVREMGAGIIPIGPPGAGGLEYERGTLAAEIAQVDDRWQLVRGRMGVQVTTSSLLRSVAAGANPLGGKQLCDDPGTYDLFRSSICIGADLAQVDASPTEKCGGFSAGFAFAAVASSFSTLDGGIPNVKKSPLGAQAPCPDPDAGTAFCDDCRWPTSRRCDASPN